MENIEERIPLSQAIEEMFDPYNSIVRESIENILQEQLDRRVEYGN